MWQVLLNSSVTEIAQLLLLGMILYGLGELGKLLISKYFRKIDTEYVTMEQFNTRIKELEVQCDNYRGSCLETNKQMLQNIKGALRILIVHSIDDKEVQQNALDELQ